MSTDRDLISFSNTIKLVTFLKAFLVKSLLRKLTGPVKWIGYLVTILLLGAITLFLQFSEEEETSTSPISEILFGDSK